jgi:transcriptional regulator with XRE-family HTH domain
MIRTDKDYKVAKKRLKEDEKMVELQRAKLKEHGLSEAEIEEAMEPLISFHLQLKEEVEWYEKVKKGDLNLEGSVNEIGLMLIGLRIALGLSQRQLAQRLGVSEPQVSRDERNEYHGITIERIAKILEALNDRGNMEIRYVKDINVPADERVYQEYLALSEQEKKSLAKKLKLSKAS